MKKIPLGMIGVDSELVIDELLHENEAGGTGGDVRVRTGMETGGTSPVISSPSPLTRIEGCYLRARATPFVTAARAVKNNQKCCSYCSSTG